jgi:hypothetical protein
VQAAGFGNIAAALTELDKALAEHAVAGGSWEERSEEGDEGDGDEGGEGGRRRRWREALLPSGTGPEDVSFFLSFCFSVFLLVLLSLWDASKVAHPEKKTSKKTQKKTDASALRPAPAELRGPLLLPGGAGAAAVAAEAERGGGQGGGGRGAVCERRVFYLKGGKGKKRREKEREFFFAKKTKTNDPDFHHSPCFFSLLTRERTKKTEAKPSQGRRGGIIKEHKGRGKGKSEVVLN